MTKTLWPFAALAIAVAGCATDPVDDEAPPPPTQEEEEENEVDEDLPYGCKIGVKSIRVDRLALGGTLDLDIDDSGWFGKPKHLTSSAPEIVAVNPSAEGARLIGVAPGTAAIEVWRCERRIASIPVTVVEVGEIEVRLALGTAGHSDPLTSLVAVVPAAEDDLAITYYDRQHVQLQGHGAARLTYEGGVRQTGSTETGGTCDGRPCELVPIEISGPGRILATAGEHELELEVTTTPAPARVDLVVRQWGDTDIRALEVIGETAGGQPIAGLAPEVTVTPAQYTLVPFGPTSFLMLVPSGETVTFTATVAGVTGTLTETFP